MLQMGFSQEEIQDSLVNQKYNDVMAAYLLLDYRNSEVHCSHTSILHSTMPVIIGLSELPYQYSYTDVIQSTIKLTSSCELIIIYKKM